MKTNGNTHTNSPGTALQTKYRNKFCFLVVVLEYIQYSGVCVCVQCSLCIVCLIETQHASRIAGYHTNGYELALFESI